MSWEFTRVLGSANRRNSVAHAESRLRDCDPIRIPLALQSLAALLNDAIAAVDTPAMQMAGATSGSASSRSLGGARIAAQSALETTTPSTRRRPVGRRLRTAPDQADAPQPEGNHDEHPDSDDAADTQASDSVVDAGFEDVDDEHVETWQLVARAQDGDGDAFGQLYDRYVNMVFRFIYYRVNDRGLAEDFTSETFLRALRRISTITYQGRDIGAWFMTIARNIVLDHVKSARHRLESTTSETPESREHAPSVEHAVLAGLQSETLMAAIRELGDEQRECIMLRFIHGMSVNETATIMGKNDGAIKALQHRAVRKLADLVGGELS